MNSSSVIVALTLLAVAQANFYLRVNKVERCLIDSFVKNQEVIVRLEVGDFEETPKFELNVAVKDINYRYYEAGKFVMKDEQKKNFIYTHISTTDAFVCFTSDVEVNLFVKIDANLKLPTNLINSDDMQELETLIFKSVTAMTDFNQAQQKLTKADDDNLKVG